MIEFVIGVAGILVFVAGLVWTLICSEHKEFEETLRAAQLSAEVERGKIAKGVRANGDLPDDLLRYRD